MTITIAKDQDEMPTLAKPINEIKRNAKVIKNMASNIISTSKFMKTNQEIIRFSLIIENKILPIVATIKDVKDVYNTSRNQGKIALMGKLDLISTKLNVVKRNTQFIQNEISKILHKEEIEIKNKGKIEKKGLLNGNDIIENEKEKDLIILPAGNIKPLGYEPVEYNPEYIEESSKIEFQLTGTNEKDDDDDKY
jgi:hypothetical protein